MILDLPSCINVNYMDIDNPALVTEREANESVTELSCSCKRGCLSHTYADNATKRLCDEWLFHYYITLWICRAVPFFFLNI